MKCLVIAFLLLVSSLASAQLDGNLMIRDCANGIKLMEGDETRTGTGLACMSALLGIMRYNSRLQNLGHEGFFCIKDGMKVMQLTRISHKFLIDHPELLHEDGTDLLIRAMIEKLPCE